VTKTLVQKNTGLSVIMNSVGGSTGKNVEQESTKEIFKNPLKA
jgi:hypothetical protein